MNIYDTLARAQHRCLREPQAAVLPWAEPLSAEPVAEALEATSTSSTPSENHAFY
jgi:hypothetical protein